MSKSKRKPASSLNPGYKASRPERASSNKTLIFAAVVAFILLAAGVAWYLTRTPPAPDAAIKIGAVLPLTGPLALFGEPERAALLQAVERANRETGGEGPGIRGRRIELIIEDSRGSARDGVSAVQKVLLQEPTAVITSLTIISNASQQILTEEKTPQIALSVHPTIAAQSEYTIRPYYGFEQEMKVLADYLKNKRAKKIGVLWVMVPECEAAIEKVLRPELGDAIVASESYNFTDTNLRPQLTKITASEPDAILVMDFGNLFGLILREAETLKVREKIIGNIGLLTAPPIDAKLLEGIVFAGPSFVIKDNSSPAYREFAADFERQTKTKPTYDVLYTRDAFDLLVKALRETAETDGKVNPDKLLYRLRNMGRHDGLTGPMEIYGGSATVGISLGVYRNGEVKPLKIE
jgi:branched-chain amino acid transport system substrate-binding protein